MQVTTCNRRPCNHLEDNFGIYLRLFFLFVESASELDDDEGAGFFFTFSLAFACAVDFRLTGVFASCFCLVLFSPGFVFFLELLEELDDCPFLVALSLPFVAIFSLYFTTDVVPPLLLFVFFAFGFGLGISSSALLEESELEGAFAFLAAFFVVVALLTLASFFFRFTAPADEEEEADEDEDELEAAGFCLLLSSLVFRGSFARVVSSCFLFFPLAPCSFPSMGASC
mmetsp:Transcript_125785/g.402650  ORF Transcript_125785/g.402650 Transcript_125785/m.402650 type:complete len:227 (+) Transcript_125785:162-842(+)